MPRFGSSAVAASPAKPATRKGAAKTPTRGTMTPARKSLASSPVSKQGSPAHDIFELSDEEEEPPAPVDRKHKRKRPEVESADDEESYIPPTADRLTQYFRKIQRGVKASQLEMEYGDVIAHLARDDEEEHEELGKVYKAAQTKPKVVKLDASAASPATQSIVGVAIPAAAARILLQLEQDNPYPHPCPVGRRASQFTLDTPDGEVRQPGVFLPCCLRCAKEYYNTPDLNCFTVEQTDTAKCTRCKQKSKACVEVPADCVDMVREIQTAADEFLAAQKYATTNPRKLAEAKYELNRASGELIYTLEVAHKLPATSVQTQTKAKGQAKAKAKPFVKEEAVEVESLIDGYGGGDDNGSLPDGVVTAIEGAAADFVRMASDGFARIQQALERLAAAMEGQAQATQRLASVVESQLPALVRSQSSAPPAFELAAQLSPSVGASARRLQRQGPAPFGASRASPQASHPGTSVRQPALPASQSAPHRQQHQHVRQQDSSPGYQYLQSFSPQASQQTQLLRQPVFSSPRQGGFAPKEEGGLEPQDALHYQAEAYEGDQFYEDNAAANADGIDAPETLQEATQRESSQPGPPR